MNHVTSPFEVKVRIEVRVRRRVWLGRAKQASEHATSMKKKQKIYYERDIALASIQSKHGRAGAP